MNDVIMHINYGEVKGNDYGKNTIDDICKLSSKIGFNGIEFRNDPPVNLSHLSYKEYVEEIAKCKKKYSLTNILFALPLREACNPDKAEREKNINEALERAKIANDICGTTTFNTFGKAIVSPVSTVAWDSYELHGSYAASQEQWDLTVDSYQKIGAKLEPLGLKLAFETHMNYIHDLPQTARKLVDLIDSPAVGINLDYGNTVYFPDPIELEDAIELCGDKLFYTHFKNSNNVPSVNRRMPCALSEGQINHRIYIRKLKEIGFKGPIGIEAPRPGDRAWYALNDFNYAKSIIDEVF